MKKILVAVVLLFVASPAFAEYGVTKICDAKLATQNTTTDCTVTDVGDYDAISIQFQCTSVNGSPSVTLNWIAGKDDSSLGIPSGLSAIASTITAETLSVVYAVAPPVAARGTVRITENNAQADTLCSVFLTGRKSGR